jgi:hypothetical protein
MWATQANQHSPQYELQGMQPRAEVRGGGWKGEEHKTTTTNCNKCLGLGSLALPLLWQAQGWARQPRRWALLAWAPPPGVGRTVSRGREGEWHGAFVLPACTEPKRAAPHRRPPPSSLPPPPQHHHTYNQPHHMQPRLAPSLHLRWGGGAGRAMTRLPVGRLALLHTRVQAGVGY